MSLGAESEGSILRRALLLLRSGRLLPFYREIAVLEKRLSVGEDLAGLA